jgi:hypothetical protein
MSRQALDELKQQILRVWMNGPVPSLGQFNRALLGNFWRAPTRGPPLTISFIVFTVKIKLQIKPKELRINS